ncbi:glycosyltransferase [Tunicatimonas pelagia]|uniref:glycosyltransferase n=1 Tax=Tunicatimonas pelagia TaxID=931531 RepID=UPI002665388C|nr:glycosyltransferase family 2 protein [Tunicatimonas pelagia]WKN42324.1 glycosyltransferase family 2 protein [Tunicatimonas pelagia]
MLLLESFLLIYLGGVVTYLFILSLAGKLRNKPTYSLHKTSPLKIAVLIPAYKEDYVIIHTLKNALKQSLSPAINHDVVIIADSLKEKTIQEIKKLPVKLVEVSFAQSTKVKALNAGLAALPDQYDIAVILDADNIMDSSFLQHICAAYATGEVVLQGRRVAKNKNTSFAMLDAASEIINNHIFRKGYNALGLSASLIGSGMAFDYKLLKDTLTNLQAVGGFDRELCLALIQQGYQVKYLEDAIVFDEKVEHAQTFAKQRRRWLSSQFYYLGKNFRAAFSEAVAGNFAYFEAAVIGNLILPRVLILGLLPFIMLASLLFPSAFVSSPLIWGTLLFVFTIALLLPIPKSFYNRKLLVAVFKIPYAFAILFITLFKLKNSNQKFIHTPHRVVLPESESENI